LVEYASHAKITIKQTPFLVGGILCGLLFE